jgi:phosphoribosylaminoimidazolecarboxamide formyltransferase/IMP cyclohydrolase
MPRALLSVSDKAGIVDLARGLAARGYELASTGGTARALTDAGLPVTNVSDITGFPEMMDGRVKTLHPALHGGILARRDRHEDLEALARHGIELVDIVVVNLYPFVKAAANPDTPFDADQEIDIGGPSLVRAAAKNFRGVLVVVDPADYRACSTRSTPPQPGIQVRADAKGHRAHGGMTARSRPRWRRSRSGIASIAQPSAPHEMARTLATGSTSRSKIRDLRYGENPSGGLVSPGPCGVWGTRRFSRAGNCRSPTSWTSTPPRASSSSSKSPPPSLSNIRTRAASRPAIHPPTRTSAPATPTASRPSVESWR